MELGDRIVVMRKGAIAQIGTPRDVYFAPKDRFVAEFIGAANIVEAPIENGALILPGGRLPIAGGATAANATVMIRPETIHIVDAGAGGLAGVVDSVSFIGDRQRMVVSGASSKPLNVDAPNTILAKVGDRVGLSIAPDALRLLPSNPENGRCRRNPS
ncbi:ABC-type Fe3+/spermidine/putrescine transport system ATPase subunit [Bradyrhizobium sp. USDA 4454]